MGYIGKKPAAQGKDAGPSLKLDDISSNFDGNTTVFDLTVGGTVVDPHINNIQIYLSGVHQLPGTSYSLSGSQVVFTGAPSSSLNFHGSLIGDSRIITPDNNTVEPASFTSNTTDVVSGSWQGVIGSGSLGMVSGSSISTGSFGAVNIGGMSVSNLVDFSSSIASRITDEESDFTAAGISGSWQGVIGSGSLGMVSGSAISTGSFGTIQTTNGTIPTLIGNTTFSDNLTVGGNLDISDTIFHTGDSNTKIRFPEVDTISFHTSGDERLRITSTGAISGSAVSTGSFGRVIISEMGNSDLTDVSSSISTRVNLLEGSGSITESSASFSTRVNLLEGSGSITESSASFSTRVNLLEGSGSINDLVTASGSFSTRVSDLKTDSGSFSTRVTTAEASGALFDGDGVVTFAGATITGTLTAQEVHTEFISASVTVSTGSNIFGDETTDVHQFTGSIETSGSILLDTLGGNVSGSIVSTGSFGAANIAGMTVSNLVDVSSSLSSRLTDVKTESGSFAAASSSYSSASGSFSTRVSDLKTDSGSFSTRVSDLKTDSGSFSTRVSDLKTDSGSFSTRVSDSNLYLSGSGTIISGSSVSTGSFGHIKLGTADIGGVHKISLSNNDAGTSNTIFGKSAGLSLDAGSNFNVFIGEGVSTGSMNDAINNVAIGYHALSTVTTGDYNVAIGDHSMMSNKSGEVNVAVGTSALRSNTGDQNTAVGGNAMYANVGGTNNTVVGHNAGDAMTTTGATVLIGKSAGSAINSADADGTVAIGKDALAALTDGENNIAIGHVAADVLTVSNRNVIIGAEAFTTAATATGQDDNIGIGYRALNNANVQDFNRNIAIGSYALSTTGTNQQTGTIAIGFQALAGNTSGQLNTAIGYNALVSNVAGDKNVALGYQAGEDYNPTADYGNSVFVGHQAGLNVSTARKATIIGNAAVGLGVMTGHENTVIGNEAGYDLTSGAANVMVGVEAGTNTTDGDRNVYIGYQAAEAATTADYNVVIGYEAMSVTDDADYNVAIGYKAMQDLGTGINDGEGFNTAVGATALSEGTTCQYTTAVGYNAIGEGICTGNFNTALGRGTGRNLTSGHSNTLVGNIAGNIITTGVNNTIIGYNCQTPAVDTDHCIILGHGITSEGGNDFSFGKESNVVKCDFDTDATFARNSDGRKKRNVKNDTLGLEFINDLRTVTYKWKPAEEHPEEWHAWNEDEDGNKVYHDMNTETTMHGMIAQEVKAALDTAGVDTFKGWDEKSTGQQLLSAEMFVFPLIKAVQELSEQNKVLEKRIEELEN